MDDNEKRFEELKQTILPRFWDTFINEMVYPQLIGNSVIFYYVGNGGGQPRIMLTLTDMLMNERFVCMKPTGLKDKNGKLIYEGDTLYDSGEDDYGFVIFEEGKFLFKIDDVCYDLAECLSLEVYEHIYYQKED